MEITWLRWTHASWYRLLYKAWTAEMCRRAIEPHGSSSPGTGCEWENFLSYIYISSLRLIPLITYARVMLERLGDLHPLELWYRIILELFYSCMIIVESGCMRLRLVVVPRMIECIAGASSCRIRDIRPTRLLITVLYSSTGPRSWFICMLFNYSPSCACYSRIRWNIPEKINWDRVTPFNI
jgi:hypothetical protein